MVDENIETPKISTVSVRIEDDLLRFFDSALNILGINNEDFLRVCIEKLAFENEALVDHSPKLIEYVKNMKKELAKLPSDMIEVINGNWDDVNDKIIVILCDELWKTVDTVYDCWNNFLLKYGFDVGKLKKTRENGLLSVEDVAMIMANKSSTMNSEVILNFLENKTWTDEVELYKISLIYSCMQAIKEKSAIDIIGAHLKKTSKEEGKEQKISVDAKGELRRSGSTLYLPVETVAKNS